MLEQDPSNELTNSFLAQLDFNREEYEEAARYYVKVFSILEANPLLLVNYAESLVDTNAVEKARKILDKLPRQVAVPHFESGVLLARSGGYEAAEEHFNLALESHPHALAP